MSMFKRLLNIFKPISRYVQQYLRDKIRTFQQTKAKLLHWIKKKKRMTKEDENFGLSEIIIIGLLRLFQHFPFLISFHINL